MHRCARPGLDVAERRAGLNSPGASRAWPPETHPRADGRHVADAPVCGTTTFGGHRIWVVDATTSNASYQQIPDRHRRSARRQLRHRLRPRRPTRAAFLGGLRHPAAPRSGWSTAGALPTDFALQLFCRNRVEPAERHSACNSAGLTIDGQGGIRLVRGDVGQQREPDRSRPTPGSQASSCSRQRVPGRMDLRARRPGIVRTARPGWHLGRA